MKDSFEWHKCCFQKAVSTKCVTPLAPFYYLSLCRGKPRMEHKNVCVCLCVFVRAFVTVSVRVFLRGRLELKKRGKKKKERKEKLNVLKLIPSVSCC